MSSSMSSVPSLPSPSLPLHPFSPSLLLLLSSSESLPSLSLSLLLLLVSLSLVLPSSSSEDSPAGRSSGRGVRAYGPEAQRRRWQATTALPNQTTPSKPPQAPTDRVTPRPAPSRPGPLSTIPAPHLASPGQSQGPHLPCQTG